MAAAMAAEATSFVDFEERSTAARAYDTATAKSSTHKILQCWNLQVGWDKATGKQRSTHWRKPHSIAYHGDHRWSEACEGPGSAAAHARPPVGQAGYDGMQMRCG